MTLAVACSACLQCSFGTAPSLLTVLPVDRVFLSNAPAATLNDHLPIVNIVPFGMCSSPANPVVAAATAAALGVLTPMPCIPCTTTPWLPGSLPRMLVGNKPALDANATLICNWAGVIKVSSPGQFAKSFR